MAGIDSRKRVPTELVVAALVAAASLPLARLFRSGGIVPTIVGSIGVSATAVWLLRRARVNPILSALIAAAGWFWFAGLIFHRDTLLVILPTPGMAAAIVGSIGDALRTATTEVAPVLAFKELLILVSMITWAATWLADDAVHKLRHPLLAIGFTLPMFVFPGTLIDSPTRWFDSGLYIAAALAVLFCDETGRLARWGRTAGFGTSGWRPGLALRIGALVTLSAIALAPLIPGYGAVPGEGSGAGGSGDAGGGGDRVALNPLVDIKPRLNRTPVTELFTVRSDIPTYWRVTALDTFNGFIWTARPRNASQGISGRTVPQLLRPPDSRQVKQQYTLRGLAGPWLPAGFEPVRVNGRKNVRLEPVTRSVVPAEGLKAGQKYEVISRIATPTAAQLDAVTAKAMLDDPRAKDTLEYPAINSSQEVEQLTKRLTQKEPTPFRKALAIQNFLLSFRYNENVADGHSFEDLETFLLDVKEGYCEQFAAAMAIMARIARIPARVAIGFGVGNNVGDGVYEISSRHAHAWVELYFPGYGWLMFEPTPRADGVTMTPPYAQPGSAPIGTPSVDATASTNPTVNPTSDESLDPRLTGDEDENIGVTDPVAKPPNRLPLMIPVAALLTLGAAVPGAAVARRRIRRRRASNPRALAASYYWDFLDWCASVRFPKRPGETPSEYAERLTESFATASEPLHDLAAAASGVFWAPGDGNGRLAEGVAATQRLGREAQRSITAELPRRARILSATGWGWWRA